MLLVSPLLFFKNSLSLSLIFLKKSFWQNSQSYEAMTLNRSHLLWSPETMCRACLIPSLGRHLRVGRPQAARRRAQCRRCRNSEQACSPGREPDITAGDVTCHGAREKGFLWNCL